jgi:hypothetical protein
VSPFLPLFHQMFLKIDAANFSRFCSCRKKNFGLYELATSFSCGSVGLRILNPGQVFEAKKKRDAFIANTAKISALRPAPGVQEAVASAGRRFHE